MAATHAPPGDSTFTIEAFAVSVGSGPHDASPAVDGRVWFTAQDSDELGLRSEAGEARGEAAVAPASSKAGHGRTRIPRNLHTRSRVDPDETTKADFVEREGRSVAAFSAGSAALVPLRRESFPAEP